MTSNDGVVRDPHYSGQPILERASVVLRLSPTWFRIGSLEILARLREVCFCCHNTVVNLYSFASLKTVNKKLSYILYYNMNSAE